jgi:hypothetical protein
MRLPPSEKGPIALGSQGPVHGNEPLDSVLPGSSMFLKLAKGNVALDMPRVYGPWLEQTVLFLGVLLTFVTRKAKRLNQGSSHISLRSIREQFVPNTGHWP